MADEGIDNLTDPRSWDVAIVLDAPEPGLTDYSIMMSGGTVTALRTGSENSFEAKAAIPSTPWSNRIPQSVVIEHAENGRQFNAIVRQLKLPLHFVEPLRRRYLDRTLGFGAQGQGSAVSIDTLFTPIAEWLRGTAQFSTARPNGVCERARSTMPMTTDPATGLRLGLHVDSWDRLPLHARRQGNLRLCINLGLRTRYFLFAPLSVVSIAEILNLGPEVHGQEVSATDIAREFLRSYPDVPVFQLNIPPGWAYIAPTENLVHDACADGNEGRDISFHATLELHASAESGRDSGSRSEA